jgi:hypothetical protein
MARNKIALSLSAEQLAEFLEVCRQTPGLTLERLQALAADRGISVSLMGAKSFRDTTYAEHMQRLRKAQELAVQMQEITAGGASINEAAASLLSQQVFDEIAEGGLDADVASKIVKRLRDSDTQARGLAHQIEKDQQRAAEKILNDPKLLAEVAKIKATAGLSEKEKVAAVQRRLFGERPANFQPHTATGAER